MKDRRNSMKNSIALSTGAVLLMAPLTGLGFQGRGQGPPLTSGVMTEQRPAPTLTPMPPGRGTLSGRIIDQETDAAVPNARVVVRLLGERNAQGNFPVTPFGQVLTAASDDLFTLNQVPFGTYVVEVDVPGYAGDSGLLKDAARRQMQVSAGRPWFAETFPLTRLGTLSGTVTDENGRPVADQAVMLLRRTDLGDPFLLLPQWVNALTDREGRYRFTSVSRGEYVVSLYFRSTTVPVAVSETFRKTLQTSEAVRMIERFEDSRAPLPQPVPFSSAAPVGEPGLTVDGFHFSVEDGARRVRPVLASLDGAITGLASTYLPGVTSLADARWISVTPGVNLTGLDIRVRRQKTSRVSGVLTGPGDAASYVALRLVPDGLDRMEQAAIGEAARTITDAAGRFTFLGIPPGRYTLVGHVSPFAPGGELRAGAGSLRFGPDGNLLPRVLQRWAKHPVVIADDDVSDLKVPLLDPFSVSGRVEVIASGDVPPPAPESIRVYLSRTNGQNITSIKMVTITNGQFSLGPFFPDEYRLRAEVPQPWRVESIVVGGRDVAAGTIKLVDRSITEVVVTLTSTARYVAALKASLVFCDAAYDTLTDATMAAPTGR
jgi:hypothetical protein